MTVAGNGTGGYCGDNNIATTVCVNRPVSVVVNRDGEVFIADEDNHIVRKIDSSGVISTVAGPLGSANFSGDGGLATSAKLKAPRGLAMNTKGELLIADAGNSRIRKVDKNGIITTVVSGLLTPVDISVGRDGDLSIV